MYGEKGGETGGIVSGRKKGPLRRENFIHPDFRDEQIGEKNQQEIPESKQSPHVIYGWRGQNVS